MPLRILNLGGGQQSTAIYFLAALGEIEPIDFAVFADTGEEPRWVYEHIEAMQWWRWQKIGRNAAPIVTVCLTDEDGQPVRLGDQLIKQAGRFASIPAFVKHTGLYGRNGRHPQGKTKRQCTAEFKIRPIERWIRREVLGLAPGQAYRGPRVTQIFGFDRSEGSRIVKAKDRLAHGTLSIGDFPLWDLEWIRADCVSFMSEVPGWRSREVLPSACTCCPLIDDRFRRLIRDHDPAGHARGCEVDAGLRNHASVATRMVDGELYVHRSMKPLAEASFDKEYKGQLRLDSLFVDCEGICGH